MAEYVVTKPCFYLGKRCSPGEIVEYDGKVVPSYLELADGEKPKRTPKTKATTQPLEE